MTKRILALVLAAMMLLTAMAGFAEGDVTISYYAYWCGSLDPGSYVESFIEDNLGINIEVKKVAHTDTEAVNLMIANDMPDCGWYNKTVAYMKDQELSRSIPIDMLREYAPSLAAYMDANPLLWAAAMDPEDDTAVAFLPDLYETYASLYLYCWFLRYDWIQKLNIDLGDVNVEQVSDQLYIADKGLSLEVFEEILRQFVKNDPDGNGVDDTIGMIKDYTQMRSAFGINENNMEVDGKPAEWYTNPKTKDMLKWLADAYAEGLIYEEIFTIQWGQDWELINNNVSGVHASSSTNSLNSWASNRPPRTILDGEDKSRTLLMIPGVADENGVTMRNRATTPMGGEKFFVRWDVDDAKLIEILKFYEYCNWNSDLDVTATLWCGEKDVDWQWNEDKTNVVKINNVINGDRGTQVFCRNTQLNDAWNWLTLEPDFAAGGKYYYKNMGGIWNDDMQYQYKWDVTGTSGASEISNEYSADWSAVRDAYFMAVIRGEKNLESDWDAYIQDLNDLEYDAYIEALDTAPTVQELLDQYSK